MQIIYIMASMSWKLKNDYHIDDYNILLNNNYYYYYFVIRITIPCMINMRKLWPGMEAEFEAIISIAILRGKNSAFLYLREDSEWFTYSFLNVQTILSL